MDGLQQAEALSEYMAIRMSVSDRRLLDVLAFQDGSASISAVIRRLIRQEAQYRKIDIGISVAEQEAPPASA